VRRLVVAMPDPTAEGYLGEGVGCGIVWITPEGRDLSQLMVSNGNSWIRWIEDVARF
jgi:hypothetical protein